MAHRRAVLFLTLFMAGCSSRTTNLAVSGKRADSGPTDASSVSDAQRDAPGTMVSDAGVALCRGRPCQCSNGLDDDGDGLIDGLDPECTSAFDDDESSFGIGLPGEGGNELCHDCFFDGNSGPGDDGCRRAASCVTSGTVSGFSPACNTCEPTQQCVNNCLPLTPNGCDCFGCCDVLTPQGTVSVLLSDSCSLDEVGDPDACPRCLPSTACKNECGRCELCLGKTVEDLPEDCRGADGLGYTCDNAAVCGTNVPCGDFAYCVQGCCTPIVI